MDGRHRASSNGALHEARLLTRDAFAALLDAVVADGYELVGPTVRDGAIVLDAIDGAGDLPAGWTDEQAPGRYRLSRRDDEALFGYAVGPHSWKQELFPPRTTICRVELTRDGLRVEPGPRPRRPRAFIGVRACELAAIAVQDRVFTAGEHVDADYAARREDVLLVAVECGDPAATCFCTSMGTGPHVGAGSAADLVLVELPDPDDHRFVATAGSERGRALLARAGTEAASADDVRAARRRVDDAAARIDAAPRGIDAATVRETLLHALEHPQWDDVADRCLACGNCTMACPTCFCSTVRETSDLSGTRAERVREWDSCFGAEQSSLHGHPVRSSVRSRYRQWLTHKLATWHDQFDESGCVGCGRCITWCPAAIDLTAEVRALAQDPGASDGGTTP